LSFKSLGRSCSVPLGEPEFKHRMLAPCQRALTLLLLVNLLAPGLDIFCASRFGLEPGAVGFGHGERSCQ